MDQLQQFKAYHDALQADRYRVTSIKMTPDGQKTFIVDKQNGETIGFTPEQMKQRMPELVRLLERGENIYFTPLSETKHHILIDDMDRDKLARFINDGYQPAILIESSPGNLQAILTVDKLGCPEDRSIGNKLSKMLNEEYGDKNLSGCIHPHRSPGFQNRKPKHQRPDGTFPTVRIVKSAARQCQKTYDLSQHVRTDLERGAKAKPARAGGGAGVSLSAERLSAMEDHRTEVAQAREAYRRHISLLCKVMKSLPERLSNGQGDFSRLDVMVCQRLLATGHKPENIAPAMAAESFKIRQKFGGNLTHHWPDYASRTISYAQGANGKEKLIKQRLKGNGSSFRYLNQWLKAERDPDFKHHPLMKTDEPGPATAPAYEKPEPEHESDPDFTPYSF